MSEATEIQTEETVTDVAVTEAIETSLGSQQFFSPYELIRVLNGLTGRNLPTQMAYNYVRKGLIKSQNRRTETGKTVKVVSREVAAEWLTKYVSKNS